MAGSWRQRRKPAAWARATPWATPWVTAVTALLMGVASLSLLVGVGPEGPAGATTTQGSSLELLSQSSWVTPGQAFDLHLKVPPTSPGATPSTQAIAVAVYPCLSSLSSFDQSIANGPAGSPMSQTSPALSVSSLPTVAGGGVDVSLPVTVDGQGGGSGGGLNLVSGGGSCQSFPSGVFPVRVELLSSSQGGTVLASLTTHLIYTQATATTQRLRAAVVLPVSVSQGATSASPSELVAHPSAALAPQVAGSVAAVEATVATVADQHAGVPISLTISGQSLALFDSPAHQNTLVRLSQLAATPGLHQLTAAPYVPVDAASLVDSGLAGELALQVARGVQTVATATARPEPSVSAGLGPWIADSPVDQSTVQALAVDGYRQLVLPSPSIPGAPTNGSTVQPFLLPNGRGSTMTAVAASADLTARFSPSVGDPVLAAHQLVAELAQIYYERPNDTQVRAVVANPPIQWVPNPKFVDTLLAALTGNPMVEPVTLSQLFALFDNPGTCRPSCRLPVSGSSPNLPSNAIRVQRRQIIGFGSATPGQRQLGQQLSDVLLGAQTATLRPSQQRAAVQSSSLALDAQLSQIAITGDRQITLTATTGRVPVTVVSTAPYPVTATLQLASDKVLFPGGTSRWSIPVTLLPHHTNVVYVQMRARTSGAFPVAVTLHSPDGTLSLATGSITVRTTTTSLVGVVLSVGAVVVLAIWWIRTWLRRRRARHQESPPSDASPTHTGDFPAMADTEVER